MMKDDLISRAAAIEYLMTNMGWRDEDGYEVDDADEKRAIITDLVNGISAVDAVPVIHGKWVEEPDRAGHYHCSKCGVVWGIAAKAMKYCPNCAAKMINSPIWDVEDEAATEMAQYCERYEPTYNPEDGSM